jgi:hypothetical protein
MSKWLSNFFANAPAIMWLRLVCLRSVRPRVVVEASVFMALVSEWAGRQVPHGLVVAGPRYLYSLRSYKLGRPWETVEDT